MEIKIIGLIKFQTEEIIKDIYKNGTIYLNTIEFFKNTTNKIKQDKNETITDLWQADQIGEIIVGGRSFDIVKNSNIKVYSPIKLTHIYSFAGLYSDDEYEIGGKIFDEKLLEHGEYLILIYNPKEFFERFDLILKKEKIGRCRRNRVEYIDEKKYHGTMNPFKKFNYYEHEQEYRLGISHSISEPVILKLGSLEDISEIFKVSDFKNSSSYIDNKLSLIFS